MSDESERDERFSQWQPTYPSTMHSDVVGECRKEWTNGRPWTNIQVLRKGVDDSDGASCAVIGCKLKVEAVQYSTSFGDAVFYCEEHAVLQQGRDVQMYDLPPPAVPPLTKEEEAFITKLLQKKKKRDERTDGPKDEDDL